MIKFTTQELEMESNLKQRIEFICEFCRATPKIINGSIKRINNNNLNYLEPHKIIINVNDIIRMYKKCNIKMHNIVHSFVILL